MVQSYRLNIPVAGLMAVIEEDMYEKRGEPVVGLIQW